jgi:hypothetical protein
MAVHLSSPSPPGADLLYIRNDISTISCLVGTGAALSLLPHRSLQAPSGLTFVIANGGIIPSWNFVFKKLSFNNQIWHHKFLQANVSQSILGTDFFKQHAVHIDFQTGPLQFPPFPAPPSPAPLSSPSPSPLSVSSAPPFPSSSPLTIQSLLVNFPTVTQSPTASCPTPNHFTLNHIHTTVFLLLS